MFKKDREKRKKETVKLTISTRGGYLLLGCNQLSWSASCQRLTRKVTDNVKYWALQIFHGVFTTMEGWNPYGTGVPCFCGRDIAWRLGSCNGGGLMAGNIYTSLCSVLGKFLVLAKYLVTLNKNNIWACIIRSLVCSSYWITLKVLKVTWNDNSDELFCV